MERSPKHSSEHTRGTIITFYSYKGGVGRTMSLANVAALLVKWGHSVLIVDWDLEAPGLERFFAGVSANLAEQRRTQFGIVDLISANANGKDLDWRECIVQVFPFGESFPLDLITAGRGDGNYVQKVESLDFSYLFEQKKLGAYIERLREEWTTAYDFVLIDSRTGITDIGGICTIHFPDILVLLFTASNISVTGVLDVFERARKQRSRLPFDRRTLIALPLPSRDESRTEYQKAAEWKRVLADRLADAYRDWLPVGKSPIDAIDLLRIPYVPYWSFGEPLPVVEEGTDDPTSLGFAFELVARFLAAKLDWNKAFSGVLLPRPVTVSPRGWDENWLEAQRKTAHQGLSAAGWNASVEVRFFSPNFVGSRKQSELLNAARVSNIHTFGWPIGVVLDNRNEYRPRPTSEGIRAEISTSHSYDYWVLRRSLDFYTLMSLFEDDRVKQADVLFVDTQIIRTTEAILYSSQLYRSLGAESNTLVKLGLRHTGMKGRSLRMISPQRMWFGSQESTEEDVVDTEIEFVLGTVDDRLVELVKELCEPLFIVFDFARVDQSVYQQIVTDYAQGRVV